MKKETRKYDVHEEATTRRHPYLANIHEMGKATSRNVSRPFEIMFYNSQSSSAGRATALFCIGSGISLGYVLGAVFGALGAKPGHLEKRVGE